MKKFAVVVLAALLFGVVAGATMLGVNTAVEKFTAKASGDRLIPEVQGEALPETQPETSGAGTGAADLPETAAQLPDGAPEAGAENAVKEIKNGKTAADSVLISAPLDVSDIVEEAMPQVVSITNTMLIKQQGYGSIFDFYYGGGFTREYEVPASGSGIIVKKTDEELLIVTNNHVVQDSKELTVNFIDGKDVSAQIKGSDSDIDVAVIAVRLSDIPAETAAAIKIANLHNTEDLKVGQGVIAIGNALGLGQTVTVGYISALDREIRTEEGTNEGLIQVDAAINPGNSGGALINMKGEVIGINVAKAAKTEIEGVGYSIPIYKAMDVIENLFNAKTRVAVEEGKQGRLGIYMNTITENDSKIYSLPRGIMVTGFSDEEMPGYGKEMIEESPARKAGILKNDIITAFDGQSIKDAEKLADQMKYYEAGSEVKITVQRLENGEYKEKEITVTLGVKKAEPENADDKTGPGATEENKEDNRENKDNSENNGNVPQEEADGGQQEGIDDFFDLFREYLEQYR